MVARRTRSAGWALAAAGVAGAAWLRLVVLPRRPAAAPGPRPRRLSSRVAKPAPDGTGVRFVVNPRSGPVREDDIADQLRSALPGAEVHELAEGGEDLRPILCQDELLAIGAAGGDGTLSAVAAIAADRRAPMVVVPAGTLNHLARDLGLSSVDDAAEAVRAGTVAAIDLGQAGERTFVNTLTLGGYSAVVDARERLEGRLGKWPALLVALVRELPRMEPLRLELDGVPMRVWLAWIGNGRYEPPGLAPAWREDLADGVLDLRIVHAPRRFSRTRFALSALAGRLSTCHVYSERQAPTFEIRSLDGPLRIAADGETFDAPAVLTVSKRREALMVAVPPA